MGKREVSPRNPEGLRRRVSESSESKETGARQKEVLVAPTGRLRLGLLPG